MSSTPPKVPDGQLDLPERAIAGRTDAANLYYQLAEKCWHARDFDGYARFFRRAYLLRPTKGIWRRPGETLSPTELRDRAHALINRGVAYAPVIGELAIAEARLGNGATVKYLMDYDRYMQRGMIDPPEGEPLQAFNSALAAEIKSNLNYYDAPPNRAIRHAWRIDVFPHATSPALRSLMQILRREVSCYIARMPVDAAHPFAASRPAELRINGWAVVSDGASHHQSHLHQRAWATGVYYVVQPEVSRAAGSDIGWLRIGPGASLGDSTCDWERHLIEPVPGSFVLMPGYFWHETIPMGVDQERICVGFDVGPPELIPGGGEEDY